MILQTITFRIFRISLICGFALVLFPFDSKAENETKCYLLNECSHWKRTSSSTNPSTGSQLKINPSAVPTEKGWGLEGIYYKDDTDLSFVRGNGRMGAALSPSNNEETFFGPPGFELYNDLYNRKHDRKKFKSQKFTLATAVNLVEKNGGGLDKFNLKLGLMGKYNELSKAVTPGAGLSGTWGPFSYGYSIYDDQTYLDLGSYSTPAFQIVKYRVQTYNFGIFLSALALDFSNLFLETEDKTFVSTVRLYTANLSLGKFIITASARKQNNPYWVYNYDTNQLEFKEHSEEYFGGVQYNLNQNITLGVLYNYYLLREYSATATLFF
ncbi:MAG: hypothetical protein ACXVCP_16515 [Bdellovibrio sp.]